MKAVLARGLENVVVAETVLSDVDGQRGRLTLRGHSVEELAPTTTFEEAVCLLWRGTLPSAQERAAARAALAAGRVRAYEQLNSLGEALLAPDAMDGLKAGLAHIQPVAEQEDWSLVGAAAVFASAWWRVRQGAAPVTPDPALTHTADYLRMLTDEEAPPERVRALEQYLVTVMDHGMNASTFTARVVASTAVDTASAVVAAVCALKGPLHGGAPGPVLDMLDAIGQPEKAEAWLRAELDAGHRVMGMGHRVYRVRDPRAAVLERVIGELEQAGEASRYLPLARAVERTAAALLRQRQPNRPLPANVEFYTAVLLEAVGLPRQLFSATFAVSRVAGWCAHIAEQRVNNRLIRPASRYIGPVAAYP